MIKFIKKTIISFLKNFENVEVTYFDNNFNLFKRAKSRIWTHVVMYSGWLTIIVTVAINKPIIYLAAPIVYAKFCIPPLISCILLEAFLLPKYRLKKRLFYENHLFSLFWIIGQLIPIMIIILIIRISN